MALFKKQETGVTVTNLNNKLFKYQSAFEHHLDEKKSKRLKKQSFKSQKKAYFIEFKGDLYARSVKFLREEVTAIIISGNIKEHVIISIESPGGTVTGYGLVAEQIDRLKKAGFYVVVVVDQVAASGGYMAASVADKIIVAKRAVIGSIGVVVNMPNYEGLLKKIGVEIKDYTAGDLKRTVTPYKTPSTEETEHLKSELAKIHEAFKSHISEYRPDVDIEKISTGQTWSGKEAIDLGLVDQIGVSDEVLLRYMKDFYMVLQVRYVEKPIKKGLLSGVAASIVDQTFENIFLKIEEKIFQNKRY